MKVRRATGIGFLSDKNSCILFNIALFVFIAQLFCLWEYIRSIMLLNFGWGNINPLRLFTIGLPALLVADKCLKERRFVLPHLGWFLAVFLGFFIMENLPFRNTTTNHSIIGYIPFLGQLLGSPVAPYSFAKEQLDLYVSFVILINFGTGKKTFYKAINYSITAGLLVCILTYIGYIGIIDIGTDFQLKQVFANLKPQPSLYYVHNISYAGIFSILFLIIKQQNEKKFDRTHVLRDIAIIGAVSMMALVNASRGAFISVAILIPCYFVLVLRQCNDALIKKTLNIIILAGLLFLALAGSKLSLVNRKLERIGLATNPTRLDNLVNTGINFKANPFLGVGFDNAAKSYYAHGSRSNNQFMQILASCGVFYALIFFTYYFKLYACNLSSLLRFEVCLSFIMAVCHSMLLRPMPMFPIFALIAFHFCGHVKNSHTNTKIIETPENKQIEHLLIAE